MWEGIALFLTLSAVALAVVIWILRRRQRRRQEREMLERFRDLDHLAGRD